MRFLYKAGIRIYFFIVLFASLFNQKARRWLKGRRGMWKRLKSILPVDKPVYWIHCSSLGEFEQGRPLIERIRKTAPDVFILLTFFSPSGYELRKNYTIADHVSYLPLDTRYNAWKFINIVKPKAVYFIKYDFWYYFLRTLKKKKVSVYLISAKFRKEQVFFKWYGIWYRKFLSFFSCLFVQDELSARLLRKINIKNVVVSGDTRFDRVYKIASDSRDFPDISVFKQDKKIIVAGSTWEKDEEILVQFINESSDDIKMILAPHEINSRKLFRLVEAIEKPVVRFTDEDKRGYPGAKVMLIDTIGHLSSIYKYGDIAYIGGGFGKGIHNILEAATYGLPVIFGPNYQKFAEANDLVEQGAAFTVSSIEGLTSVFDSFFLDGEKLESSSVIARNYVRDRLGATKKILDETL